MGVKCTVCGRTKKPIGRDSRDNGLCSHDCEGYKLEPYAPSYWPSELHEEYQRGYADGLKKAVEIMKYHPEGEGEWCDTGEDMEWACRSECVERAIKRITAALKEATDGKE